MAEFFTQNAGNLHSENRKSVASATSALEIENPRSESTQSTGDTVHTIAPVFVTITVHFTAHACTILYIYNAASIATTPNAASIAIAASIAT